MASQEQKSQEKVKLTVSQVLSDLKSGLDRREIGKKYNLSTTDIHRLFEHPKLKGKRVTPTPKFELEDDTSSDEAESSTTSIAKEQAAVTDTAAVSETKSSPAPQAEVASQKGSW